MRPGCKLSARRDVARRDSWGMCYNFLWVSQPSVLGERGPHSRVPTKGGGWRPWCLGLREKRSAVWTPGPEGGRGGGPVVGSDSWSPAWSLCSGTMWRITILKVCGGEDTPTSSSGT